MLLQKTDKARSELSPGVRTLSLRERSLLLLAEGRPLEQLQSMYHGAGADIVARLLEQGYLALENDPAGVATPRQMPRQEPPRAPRPASHGPLPSASLRSLAGARMYLFDLCERLFARRDPDMAREYREALRNARDGASMLATGDRMFAEVARAAGSERAQALRERLEQLLPLEVLASETPLEVGASHDAP